jgi:hypothetical protein
MSPSYLRQTVTMTFWTMLLRKIQSRLLHMLSHDNNEQEKNVNNKNFSFIVGWAGAHYSKFFAQKPS